MKPTIIDHYYATEDGNIFSDKTGVLKPMAKHTRKDRYQTVRVTECQLVHRLVASAYLGDITGLTVNHIDGNPSNNCVSNLEIVTMKSNVQHALRTGLTPMGEKHSRAKYSDAVLLAALSEIFKGASVSKTAKDFGITQSYLNKVKNGVYRADLLVLVTG